MKILNILILLLLINTPSKEQDFSTDQEEVDTKPIFIRGIYLTFEDFIHNYPIDPSQIQTKINPNSKDFYLHLVREPQLNVKQGDSIYSINPQRMWGYSDGKGVYINRKVFPKGFLEYAGTVKDISVNPWAKINILGTLSLIYYVKNIKNRLYTLIYNPGTIPGTTTNAKSKPKQFILNTIDGSLHKATLENLEKLITHDAELLNEFKKFKKDKDIKLYIFLKKYNAKYPTNFH